MAFNQRKLDKVYNQSRGIFDRWVYRSDEDTIAEITSPGYFAASRFADDPDWKDNPVFIDVLAADGPYEVQLVGGVASVVSHTPILENLFVPTVANAWTYDSSAKTWTKDTNAFGPLGENTAILGRGVYALSFNATTVVGNLRVFTKSTDGTTNLEVEAVTSGLNNITVTVANFGIWVDSSNSAGSVLEGISIYKIADIAPT